MSPVYQEWRSDRWHYWTLRDGARVSLTESQFDAMVEQGVERITVLSHPSAPGNQH